MEANIWILWVVAVAIVALVIYIIIRNKKDKDEYIESLNASDDQNYLIEKDTKGEE